MDWLSLSVLAAVAMAARNIVVAGAVRHESPLPFASAYNAVSSCLIAIGMLASGARIGLHPVGLAAGVLAGLTSALIVVSISKAPNAGYTSGVFISQAAITAIFSHYLLGSPLGLTQVLSIALVVAGVALLGGQAKRARETKGGTPHRGWLTYALLAAAIMSAKDLLTKHALSVGGRSQLPPLLFSSAITQTLTVAALAWFATGRILPRRGMVQSIRAGTLFATFHVLIISAIAAAPNAGYVRGAAGLGVALTALGAKVFYGESIRATGYTGIALVLMGVAGLGFAK